jgi:hypothetical protein
MSEEKTGLVDRFEFFAAILLGAAAICTALSSFQAGLWDGIQADNYGKANTEATLAASERSRAVVEMSKDASVDIAAKRLILEADDNPNEVDKNRAYEYATYMYTKQFSDPGYKALGFPPEAKKEVVDDPTTPAEEKEEVLQETILEKALEKDLGDDENYRKEMLAESVRLNEQSEKTFKAGQTANDIGDNFELANVIFAVSLFFLGIALIFRTSIRWYVLWAGGLLTLGGLIFMLTLSWTFVG